MLSLLLKYEDNFGHSFIETISGFKAVVSTITEVNKNY